MWGNLTAYLATTSMFQLKPLAERLKSLLDTQLEIENMRKAVAHREKLFAA